LEAIVEVKSATDWKNALGQVLAYGCYYPGRAKVVHLIGDAESPNLTEQINVCNIFGVVLRYQSLQSCVNGPPKLGTPLTANPPSSGRLTAGFAVCKPPLMSNVRPFSVL
jgi:hypothetical protein